MILYQMMQEMQHKETDLKAFMINRLKRHLQVYKGLRNFKLPWDLEGSDEQILAFCENLKKAGFTELGDLFEEMVILYLFHKDQPFIPHLSRLLQRECEPYRITYLVRSVPDQVKLSNYDTQVLEVVLKDTLIGGEFQFCYLKYFYDMNLNDDAKTTLTTAFSNLLRYCDKGLNIIDELNDQERQQLLQPVMSTCLLCNVLNHGDLWHQLQNQDNISLFNYLITLSMDSFLDESVYQQLINDAGSIKSLLKEMLKHVESDKQASLVWRIFENNNILNDLTRLNKVIIELSEVEIMKIIRNHVDYINLVYGNELKGLDLEQLSYDKRNLLVYAIKNRKKNFLQLVRDNYDILKWLPDDSILTDRDTYENFLNVNTLTKKTLQQSGTVKRFNRRMKQALQRPIYVFQELVALSKRPLGNHYKLYHYLTNDSVDDRLNVFQEVLTRNCLSKVEEEEQLEELGRVLSIKRYTRWLAEDLGHIREISDADATFLLAHWSSVKRFIPDLKTGFDAVFLGKVIIAKELKKYNNFQEIADRLVETDDKCLWMIDELNLEDHIKDNKERFADFIRTGGAEIIHAYSDRKYHNVVAMDGSTLRKLIIAEIRGEFSRVKYAKNDLLKELGFPISKVVEENWMKSEEVVDQGYRLWEEDGFLPTMQIGERPYHTCLSYRNGKQISCLLALFDTNKKILYVEKDGKIVFRALIRLTKGSYHEPLSESGSLQFVDVSDLTDRDDENEQLVLFLERHYFKKLKPDMQLTVLKMIMNLLKKKADELGAIPVISNEYDCFADFLKKEKFLRTQYYLYISASKSGLQYLDSLGGMASASSSGSYKRNLFWVLDNEK